MNPSFISESSGPQTSSARNCANPCRLFRRKPSASGRSSLAAVRNYLATVSPWCWVIQLCPHSTYSRTIFPTTKLSTWSVFSAGQVRSEWSPPIQYVGKTMPCFSWRPSCGLDIKWFYHAPTGTAKSHRTWRFMFTEDITRTYTEYVYSRAYGPLELELADIPHYHEHV